MDSSRCHETATGSMIAAAWRPRGAWLRAPRQGGAHVWGPRGNCGWRPGDPMAYLLGYVSAGRIQSNPMLIRNKQLCSTCREIKMVQPRTMTIPHNLKLSFENFMSHRMMSLHPPKAPAVSKCSRNDISRESVRYRLPILGPRISVFHGLLTDTYTTLQETQLSSLPGKEPTGKTMR